VSVPLIVHRTRSIARDTRTDVARDSTGDQIEVPVPSHRGVISIEQRLYLSEPVAVDCY
jgi:hypothetical protein